MDSVAKSFPVPASQRAGGETTKQDKANRCKPPVPTMNARYYLMRQKVSESSEIGNTFVARVPARCIEMKIFPKTR